MPDVMVSGCAPEPLAHYLKALGVLRLIAEQADPEARGFWQADTFMVQSTLDQQGVEQFFLDTYRPTSIVAPWNGGSGFYPKDNTRAILAIEQGAAPRFAPYRETITCARNILQTLALTKKVSQDHKALLLEACRARLPGKSVAWLDAAFVLTTDGVKYPPILGTGGNDGRLDFTNNFMQRLLDVIEPGNGVATSQAPQWLRGALYGGIQPALLKGAAIGQFFPGAAGGANAQASFMADSLINPWDFIFMLEGSLLFASATVKRLEAGTPGALSYPFSVRQSGAGYGSAARADESSARAEIWLPLWQAPTSLTELHALMAEGRAQIGRRPARTGVDFARAVAGLGVDRGITAFQRYGFQVRNGLAYFATPLGRFVVRRQPQVDLLSDVDAWLDRFRRAASADQAPASAGRALRRLDEAILRVCQQRSTQRLQEVLIALGECERVMVTSFVWTQTSGLTPIPPLSAGWLDEANDQTPVFRLAAAASSVWGRYGASQLSVPLRSQMEPVHTWIRDTHLQVAWQTDAGRDVAWHGGSPIAALGAVLARRILKAVQAGCSTFPDHGGLMADPGDIADFIEGRANDHRLMALLWGLLLLDWPAVHAVAQTRVARPDRTSPGAAYALLKLCFAGQKIRDVEIPLVPEIYRRAVIGDGVVATRLAARRLRASGLVPAVHHVTLSQATARRIAAALVFPVSAFHLERFAQTVLRTQE
jgi:CRISPR-associated protein Csx17